MDHPVNTEPRACVLTGMLREALGDLAEESA